MVVATRDRAREVWSLLASLAEQTRPPERIVVVDGGALPAAGVIAEFPSLGLLYIKSPVASAAGQRNLGIDAVGDSSDLIAFADDAVVFERDVFQAMGDFWRHAPEDLGGAGFNMMNHPRLALRSLKRLPPVRKLHLYSPEPGAVLRSGSRPSSGGFRRIGGWNGFRRPPQPGNASENAPQVSGQDPVLSRERDCCGGDRDGRLHRLGSG
ncbi:MAG: glycosyltransferase family 2 protein [Candidatus Aminicenantes bacterium]|nr:glycosyltransferase family 2 protein [Candidatus Aminicenantes bacterium]